MEPVEITQFFSFDAQTYVHSAVWRVLAASFWSWGRIGVLLAVGICGLLLLWAVLRMLKGGKKMVELEEKKELNMLRIQGLEYGVTCKSDSIQMQIKDSMRKISDALIFTLTAKDQAGMYQLRNIAEGDEKARSTFEELERKNKILTRASSIGIREDELVACITELGKNLSRLVRSAYETPGFFHHEGSDRGESEANSRSHADGGGEEIDGNHFKPPLISKYAEWCKQYSCITGATSREIRKLAALALFKNSTDKDMIETCCELVVVCCGLENDVVTEMLWGALNEGDHPGGLIGHTYNILLAFNEYGDDFKGEFCTESDECFLEAKELREEVNAPIASPVSEGSLTEVIDQTITYLGDADLLLQSMTLLIKDASDFVKNLLPSSD
ncbi:MAG: hypothetical protein HXS40_11120 [Theionarchaea archaeon]|nr:hypothetical protein [Theionarchaea archaeon]